MFLSVKRIYMFPDAWYRFCKTHICVPLRESVKLNYIKKPMLSVSTD